MRFHAPFTVYVLRGTNVTSLILAFELPSGGLMNVGEMFRRNIGRAIEKDPEMELLGNDWVTAKRRVKGNGRLYFLNILLTVTSPFEEASAIVTAARRRT